MALQLENVAHQSGAVETIRNVSLTLEAGAINVLLGPTLSGKTTLMRLMAGLETPTSGRITMNGADVTGKPVTKRSVAMVYQQFINYPSFTVYENIASPLRKQRVSKPDIDAKVRDVAALLKLEPYLDKTPLQLSGGQQQRTAIARAIVKNAELVLLDEPLANLDYKLREELRIELPRIFDASGAIFVYATTEPSEALLLGGRTATLHEGRVTQFGPTPLVYRRPRDRITAQTFSDPPMNFARIAVASGRAAFATAQTTTFACPPSFAGLPDGLYTIGFRAHHAALASQDASRFAVTGIVTVAELSGSDTFLHLDLPGGERWIALLTGVHDFAPGVSVTLTLDPARFFAFDTSGDLVAAPAGA